MTRIFSRAFIVGLFLWASSAFGAITFVGGNTDGNNNVNPDTGLTITVPAGTADDDFLIAILVESATSAEDPDLETGFTELFDETYTGGADTRCSVQYRKAASEPANYTFTWTGSGSNLNLNATILSFRGVDTTTPWDVTYVAGTHRTEHLNDNTPTLDAITTVTDLAWVLGLACIGTDGGSGTDTSMTSYTERIEQLQSGGMHALHSREITTAGVETPGDMTLTGAAAGSDVQTMTLALRPALVTTWTDDTVDVGTTIQGTLSVAFSGNITKCVFASTDELTASSATTSAHSPTRVRRLMGARRAGVTDPFSSNSATSSSRPSFATGVRRFRWGPRVRSFVRLA